MRLGRIRRSALLGGVVFGLAVTGCLPAPTTGRPGPVRRVAVLGDSISWGLFSTTPWVRDELASRLRKRRVDLTLIGGPAETPLLSWPGWAPWIDELRNTVATVDPDIVIVQSMLFPGADDPANQELYRTAVRELLSVAQSRGAHVFVVMHAAPPSPTEARETFIAQSIQADEATGLGIGVIDLGAALRRCRRPFVTDGWHISAAGQRCHADAVVAAVDGLRRSLG